MADEARIRELLEEILESKRTPEEVCAGDLELLPLVRERLDHFRAVNAHLADVFPDAAAVDPPTASAVKPGAVDDALSILAPGRGPGVLGMLDHYEVLEVVGRGGMGVVYKARDTKLQRVVAIKALAPALAADGTARKRFVREAQAAAAVRDDHVVGIHAVHDEGPVTYLVMEFISGTNLAKKVKEFGPLALKEILRIGMQTAAGLAAAHKQGLVHRDIKPANILLENGVQRVKIADFGLARAVDNVGLTQSGVVVGTPLYMAPEQARGEAVDQRTDLFSLGSVLYTLCTGRPAFKADNTLAVLKRVCELTPRPIRDANPDLPDWLAAIVDKLLAKDPKDRYQSAAEVAQLLSRHLADVQQPGSTTAPTSAPAPISVRRKPFAKATVVLGLAFVLGIAAVVAMWPKPASDPRVLTVSKNPKDHAQFQTIKEALDQVRPNMTIRVLDRDNAMYEEQVTFDNPATQSGVVLEAVGKATIRFSEARHPPNKYVICIRGVPRVTLRGFHVVGGSGNVLVFVTKYCPGTILEKLTMTAESKPGPGVELYDVVLKDEDEPIEVRNSMVRGTAAGIGITGAFFLPDSTTVTPLGRIIVRNNEFRDCGQTIHLTGSVYQVLVVGNLIVKSGNTAFELQDLMHGTKDVWIANNTSLSTSSPALRIWDDGDEILKCKNVRFQNNLALSLGPPSAFDMAFFDHDQGVFANTKSGDPSKLLTNRQWQIGNNWRESTPPTATFPSVSWIDNRPKDTLRPAITVMSRAVGQPNFLKPPKDSPLAKAGVNDGILPPYVGAIPPEGVKEWDWNVTWKALTTAPSKPPPDPRVLTVSQNPSDGAKFRTIKEALDQVKPNMTIRILDDALYEEDVVFDDAVRQSGVKLEGTGRTSIRFVGSLSPGKRHVVWIHGVPGVELRGLRIESGSGNPGIFVTDHCPGVILENLELTPNKGVDNGVEFLRVYLKDEDEPIVMQKCTIRGMLHGIFLLGANYPNNRTATFPLARIVIRNNEFIECEQTIGLFGMVRQVLVAGNKISRSSPVGIDFQDLLGSSSDIVIANNTMWSNPRALRIMDAGDEILKCKNIRFQNNLVLNCPPEGDLIFMEHDNDKGVAKNFRPGELSKLLTSPQWHIGNNWREITPPPAATFDGASWIPECRNDKLHAKIDVLSRTLGQPNFLKPPKDSPLGKAGVNDGVLPPYCDFLPPYVGAVPPEGVQKWDWNVTWKALTRKD